MRDFHSRFLVRSIGSLALAVLVSLPAWGANSPAPSDNPQTASPGAINYVEGQAKIGSETLSSQSVGKVQLKQGQTVETQDGRVEMLLTPGVFLRLGQDTSVTMLSPSLTNTKVQVNSGEATAEVDEYHSQNNLMVDVGDATVYLVHTGFYDFDPQQGIVRVLKGQAVVLRNDRHVRVNSGRQVNLFPETPRLKTAKFNKDEYKKDNPLYSWSKLRSQYLAEANVNSAPQVYAYNGWGGPGYWGPGWYWNPWFDAYTFIPGGGVIYSPFGWGFYSPWTIGYAPYTVYGGRARRFDHGFDSWGMRGVERPRGHFGARGFQHDARSAPEYHGEFHGGFRGSPDDRR
jgi:hypothetical protein